MFKSILDKILNFDKRDGRVFYCNSLHGQSTYNICINCDMTVSCNCQDYDGSGHIGNLRTHTFEEIFRGGKAQQFREALARGEYPVPLCPNCPELRTGSKRDVQQYLKGFDLPRKAIMVENTILCNLHCLFCDRTKTQKIRGQNRMTLEDMEVVAKIIRDVGIAEINFHNLGEPFISDTFAQEIALLRKYNPDLRMYMSTNGVLIDTDDKVKASVEFHHLYFSIDGPNQEILVTYQVGGDFDKSYANLKRVVDERNRQGKTTPTIEWKYVVFNWNDADEHIIGAIDLAREAGVDLISFMKGGAPLEHASTRYDESPFFRTLGEPSWRGKEIWFR